MKRKVKICESYQASLRHATKHTKKELAKVDAQNTKLDKMDLFDGK